MSVTGSTMVWGWGEYEGNEPDMAPGNVISESKDEFEEKRKKERLERLRKGSKQIKENKKDIFKELEDSSPIIKQKIYL